MENGNSLHIDGTVGLSIVKLNFPLKPKHVVYNDPATVIVWDDGTKTVVKCHDGDVYDKREGFLLCCAKKLMGNTGSYNDEMKERAPELHGLKFCLDSLGKGL